MKRLFFKSNIEEIEKIVDSRKPDEDFSDILHELSFRKTRRAKHLLKKLQGSEINPDQHHPMKMKSQEKVNNKVDEDDEVALDDLDEDGE